MNSLAAISLFLGYCFIHSAEAIRLNGNGYEDIVVFIGDSIPEDSSLLRKIEDWLTESSQKLYIASRYHVYLRNVAIRVPKSWSTKASYQSVSKSEGSKSNIIIDYTDPRMGNKPYTFGQTMCGKEAQFTIYSPDVIRHGNTGNYGNLGILFIHEWGHLRWGLFDEYASAKDNQGNIIEFYLDNGKLEPVRCTLNVTGVNRKSIHETCSLDSTGRPEFGCRFYPYRDNRATAKGSIMGHSFIPSVEEFCDSKGDQETPKHNSLAPNLQNRLCGGRSAWDVMREHADFKALTPGDKSVDTKPKFSYIQPNNVDKISLVIDVSGSMSEQIKFARNAVISLIKLIIPDATYLSIVTFSSVAHLKQPLTQILSEQDREKLVNALPSVATGLTSIGSGVQRAMREFRVKQGSSIKGSIIYLTSDGQDGDSVLQNIMPDVIQSGVIIHTLAIGAGADDRLGHIAKSTGGLSYFYSTKTQNSTALIDALSEPFRQGESNDIIKVQSKYITQNSNQPYRDSFSIDDSIGNDTVIQYTGQNLDGVRLSVTTPSGKIFTEVGHDSNQGVVVVKLPGTAKAGDYKVNLSSESGNVLRGTLGVQSKPVDPNKGVIKVKSWMADSSCTYSATMRCPVYVSVLKGRMPVSNADVTVIIENDSGTSRNLKLKDNGIGADIVGDDGIYSAYILASYINGNGRHSIKAIVKGVNSTITSSVSGVANPDIDKGTLEGKALPTFMRIGIGQEFIVKNYIPPLTPNIDSIPPSSIQTLSLEKADDALVMYTISWKAVGDDFDTGRANSYDMRISKDYTALVNNPDEQKKIRNNMVPQNPGNIERFVIDLDNKYEHNTTYFVAVRARDDFNLTGDISNIVSISILVDKSWTVPLEQETGKKFNQKHFVDPTQQTLPDNTRQRTLSTEKSLQTRAEDTSKKSLTANMTQRTLLEDTSQQTSLVDTSQQTHLEDTSPEILPEDSTRQKLPVDTSQQTVPAKTSQLLISESVIAVIVGIVITLLIVVVGIVSYSIIRRRKTYVIKNPSV